VTARQIADAATGVALAALGVLGGIVGALLAAALGVKLGGMP
jgi:hypothetical protein